MTERRFRDTLLPSAYVALVLADLATTHFLLVRFPDRAGEWNAVVALVLASFGLAGVWALKLAALPPLLFVYARAWKRSPRATDAGLTLACVIALVLVAWNTHLIWEFGTS